MHAPRLLSRVVLAVALMLGISGLVAITTSSAASAKQAKAPRVYPSWPVQGEAITLTGTVGKSVSRLAKLQAKSGGAWRTVAKKKLKKSGKYSFALTQASPSAKYRVVVPKKRVGKKTYSRKITKVRSVSLQAQSQIISTVRSVKAGTPARLTMWLSPVRNGRPVVVQRNNGSGWTDYATVVENGIGQAAYDYTASEVGSFEFRAVQTAFNGAPASVSTSVPLAVIPAQPVLVAAHRGASLNNPENTKPAIRNAVKLGADAIELDLQQTAPDPGPDGARHWILLHDKTFARTTNIASVFPTRVNDPVSTFTLAEIKQLDAGGWKNTQFACKAQTGGAPAPTTGNCRVPTLEEVIGVPGIVPPLGSALPKGGALVEAEADQANGGNTSKVILEHKCYGAAAGCATEMADLYNAVKTLQPSWIHAADHDDKVAFTSFNYATEFSQFQTGEFADDGVELGSVVDDVNQDAPQSGLTMAHIRSDLLTASLLKSYHDLGILTVGAWTVDSADTILGAATQGTDMVITDDIELARSTLLR